MLVQTGLGEVGIGAVLAWVGLLLAMDSDKVLLQMDVLRESVFAHVAHKRFLQLVHPLVSLQIRGRGEPLFTKGTRMRFGAGVNHEVLLQMSQLLEGLATGSTVLVLHVATVWSHLSVCSIVNSQVAQLAKLFATFRTLIHHLSINFLTSNRLLFLLNVRLEVHGKSFLHKAFLDKRQPHLLTVEGAFQDCLVKIRLTRGFNLHHWGVNVWEGGPKERVGES